MGFGALGAQERITIQMRLQGATETLSAMHKVRVGLDRTAAAQAKLDAATAHATKRGFLYNQMLFSLRRTLFYSTLGFIGLGVAIVKMGFDFNSTMQTAKVGLEGFIRDPIKMKKDLNEVFKLAALTPFAFQPVMLAVRRFMPVTNSFAKSLQIVKDVGDMLAGMGVTTDAALQRATYQLTHLFNVGHLTGQMLQILGRDNIMILQALQKEYHKTGEEIKHMVATGQVTPNMVVKSLHDFVQNGGFKDAAERQSKKSFSAAWTTFKDIMSMASGGATLGLFTKMQSALIRANGSLADSLANGKITINQVATAIDTGLTPKTHTLIFTYYLLRGAIEGILIPFYVLWKIIAKINWVMGILGVETKVYGGLTRWLGRLIGLLIVFLLIENAVLAIQGARLKYVAFMTRLYGYATIVMARITGIYTMLVSGETAALFANGAAMSWSTKMTMYLRRAVMALAYWSIVLSTRLWEVVAGLYAEVAAYIASTAVTEDYTTANGAVTISEYVKLGAFATTTRFITASMIPALIRLWLAMWPIALVAVILLGIYELWHRWKAFRDFLKGNWKIALVALLPIIGMFLATSMLVYKYWDKIYGTMKKILGLPGRLWHWATGTAIGRDSSLSDPKMQAKIMARWGKHSNGFPVKKAAFGGRTSRMTDVLIGEHGPEVMRLPGGSMIQPILGGVGGVGNINITVVPQAIYLDGRKIGDSVAQAYANVEARR